MGGRARLDPFLGPLPRRGPGTRWPLWASKCLSDKKWNRSSLTHWSPKQSISGWSSLKERPVMITVSFLSASSSRLTSVSSQYQGQPGPTADLPSPAPKGPPRELAGASLHLQGIISLRQRNGGPLGRGEVGRTPGPTTVYLCLHAPCSRQLTTQQSHTASPLGSHLWDRFPTLMRTCLLSLICLLGQHRLGLPLSPGQLCPHTPDTIDIRLLRATSLFDP